MITKKTAATIGRVMGWFSIGLGAAEVLGAKPIARWLGVDDHAGKIRAFGFRELKAGYGILKQREDVTAGALWSRVLGDAMDLAALASASRSSSARPGPLLLATLAVGGATILDVLAAIGLQWGRDAAEEAIADVAEAAEKAAKAMGDAFPSPTAVGAF